MSQSRGDPGQSMDEILASIRRIIAAGDGDSKKPEAGAAVDAATPAVVAPDPTPPAVAAPSPIDADILVLTEMVREDGTVISLPPETSPAAAPLPDTSTLPPPDVPPAALTAVDDELAALVAAVVGRSTTEVKIEAAVTPAAAPTPQPTEAVAVETPATTVTITAAVTPARDMAPHPTDAADLNTPAIQQEGTLVSAEERTKSELVSEETVMASTAALAQLAQSVSRPREAPGSSRTVDELVREAVEPMLRQWLDANLSRIVERMVREAIERVVRRAE